MPNTQGNEPTVEDLEAQVKGQIETSKQPTAEQREPNKEPAKEPELIFGKYKSLEEAEKGFKHLEKQLGDSDYRFPDEVIDAVMDENPNMTRKQAAKQLKEGITREITRAKLDKEEKPKEVKVTDEMQEAVQYVRSQKFEAEYPQAKGALSVLSKLSKLPEYRGMSYSEIYDHPDNASLRELYMGSANAMTVAGSTPSKLKSALTADKIEEMGSDPKVKPEELEQLIADMVGNTRL